MSELKNLFLKFSKFYKIILLYLNELRRNKIVRINAKIDKLIVENNRFYYIKWI